MTRYHINPATNRPNKCRAKIRCQFQQEGAPEVPHFDTKEEAQAYANAQDAATYGEVATITKSTEHKPVIVSPEEELPVLQGNLQQERPHHRMIEFYFRNLDDNDTPWSADDTEDFATVMEIHTILRDPNPENIAKANELYQQMHVVEYPPRYHADIHKRRDKNLQSLASYMIDSAVAEQYEGMNNPPQRPDNDRMFGLDTARYEAVEHYNNLGYDFTKEHYLSENVTKYIEPTLDRIAAGEVYDPPQLSQASERHFAKEENVLMSVVSNPENNGFDRTFYMQTVFPENELRESLERHNVDNVSVSFVPNGREDGLAYTVMQPDGSTRTFNVYEHRNTDSIVIAGTTNWKPGTIPRSSDSKDAIFAEFAPEDARQVADALTFYLQSAQRGDLPDDKTLEATSERRDWLAILDEDIPGFKQWAQDHGYGNTTRDEKLYGHKMPKIAPPEDDGEN